MGPTAVAVVVEETVEEEVVVKEEVVIARQRVRWTLWPLTPASADWI